MSEAETVEITNLTIKTNKSEIKSNQEENTKRKLSNDDFLEQSNSEKKLCCDDEHFEESSLLDKPTPKENLNEDSTLVNEETLEKNDTEKEPKTEKIKLDTSTFREEQNNVEATFSDGFNDEDESMDEYDEALIKRTINSLTKETSNKPKIKDDQITIALDSDSEDDKKSESMEEYNDANTEELNDETSFLSLNKRIMRYNPKFYFARRLIKKSIKVLLQKSKAKNLSQLKQQIKDESNLPSEEETQTEKNSNFQQILKTPNINDALEKIEEKQNLNINDAKKNETFSKSEISVESKSLKICDDYENFSNKHEIQKIKISEEIISNDESTKFENLNESEIGSFLNEISSSTVDEIMSRYVFCKTSHSSSSLSIDEFSEQLFYCLQENKKQLENIQRIWNQKVHLKFKMREIMERIRRQRVISEIEAFGVKPTQDTQPLLSSKSSTTNSENEHYNRTSSKLSSQSVNRLIQDVRENVLRKEKNKINDDSTVNINIKFDENFEECSPFGLSNNMFQASSNQGRQGQIIDVQSIINDFRQKNPQEIPRRGRRMKNSFPDSYFLTSQIQTKGNDKVNNSTSEHNNPDKNSVGFPEVSLLPVNSFYKNHTSQFGQKSSLLQSILTKQPNKSSLAIQSNNKSSTLARLLTAPEKTFHGPSRNALQHSTKLHNNGEITITPITGTSRRQLLDDEENSEPPLVIDESDDFEMNECPNTSESELLCQGCRRSKALFMCAGCSRQWYCSKECQELAWDDHAESCTV